MLNFPHAWLLPSFRHHSERTSLGKTFFDCHFILKENILFWLTILSETFVFSVSVLCSQIFTLKLNLWPKIGLNHAISIAVIFLAHLSSAQDELLWSLFVRRPSVRPSVNIFKRLLLWSRWANFAQISYGASLGWGNERLLKWSRSVD